MIPRNSFFFVDACPSSSLIRLIVNCFFTSLLYLFPNLFAVLSLCGIALKKHTKHFNSRPSARGDDALHTLSTPCPISIHAPPRGATAEAFELYASFKIFSIHAPPRGATRNTESGANQGEKISIHAPPRGATFPRSCRIEDTPYFNSRPSARGDAVCNPAQGWLVVISIHAPPRGATADFAGGDEIVDISIHAPPRGATCS